MSEEEKAAEAKKAEAVEFKNKGNAAYKAKNFEEAIAAYDKAIELDPSDSTFVNNKAAVYLEMGEIDTCLELVQGIIDKSKDGYYDFKKLSKAWARKGAALAKKGEFDEAIAAYDQAMVEHNDYSYKLAKKEILKK